MQTIHVQTHAHDELVDITPEVQELVSSAGIEKGVVQVFVPHTTAGVTINEGADPAVKRDIIAVLRELVPTNFDYHHAEGNSPSHVKASLMGSSVQVFVEGGRLKLGTWQKIFLCEFDGPRRRKVWMDLVERSPR